MKKVQLATITLLGLGLFVNGVQAYAAPSLSVNTPNEVTFSADTDEETVVQPPVPDPDVEIEPYPPGQTGPLTIAYAPRNMKFGEQSISTQRQSFGMIAEEQPLADGTGDVPYVSFVQVQDTRGTHAGWDLSVDLTNFVSVDSGHILAGAQIEFVSPSLVYNAGEGDQTRAPEVNTNEGTSLLVNANSTDTPIMKAAEGKGAGTSSTVWGNQSALNSQFVEKQNGDIDEVINDAIRLNVPGDASPMAETYRATLTWTLAELPNDEGEIIP
jgi:hypothetical protein